MQLRGLSWLAAGFSLACQAATNVVTTTADSGAGSLRQAMLDANATPGLNTIQFSIGSGAQTINIVSALPTITNSVIIDGTTQPGFAGTPLVRIDGGLLNIPAGLTISAGNSAVRGLVITGFGSGSPGYGIVLSTNGGNTVAGNFIGLTTADTARRNSGDGIFINNSAGNTIGGTTAAARNVIAANSRDGILISGPGASNTVILGNYIGLKSAGTNLLGNNVVTGSGGITLSNAPNNTIGGTSAGSRNVIAGDNADAVVISGTGSTGNGVAGNYIGIGANGSALGTSPSFYAGVRIAGAAGNTIGGTSGGAGNVLSGNQWAVNISGGGAAVNVVQGNFVGTDPSGTAAIPNRNGVFLFTGAFGTLVGGTTSGARNLISANLTAGVTAQDSSGNSIQGNFIGTDVTGMSALPNGGPGSGGGIQINNFSLPVTNNLIGGTAAGAPNVISGNHNDGLDISGTAASNNVVQGNLIGVAADGVSTLGNDSYGITMLGTSSNLIGGAISGAGNTIANNGIDGVWLAATFGAGGLVTSNSLVQGNTIYSNAGSGVTMLGPNVLSQNSISTMADPGLAVPTAPWTRPCLPQRSRARPI
jgi:titin